MKIISSLAFSKVKRSLLWMLVWVVNQSSAWLAKSLILVIEKANPAIVNGILRRLAPNSLCRLKGSLVNEYCFLESNELNAFQYAQLKKADWDTIQLPKVWEISRGGELSVWNRDIVLYRFKNAVIQPFSDFIRIEGHVYWDKQDRFQLVKMIPLDGDLVSYNGKSSSVYLRQNKTTLKIKVAFSLCGVHVNSWGHFIGNFLPKIASLDKIHDEPELVIIVPNSVDAHIKELISICVKRFNNYQIIYVDSDSAIQCETLFYCSGC